jgi:RimJ/RimL family protein N-acetyltransferase
MTFDDVRLDTTRLLLRPPRLEDLDAWAAMMTDEETARFIGGVIPRAVVWRGLMTMIGSWHALGFAMFSVIEKSSGRWVGRLGPWMPEGWPGPEDRLGDCARMLGTRIRDGRLDCRHQLGVRSPALDAGHSQHPP